MDTVVAPSINAVCSDRSFAYDQDKERFDPFFSAAMFGLPPWSHNSEDEVERFGKALPGFPAEGVLGASSPAQLPFPPMQVPQLQKLILDSGKLAKLDAVLTELKANGHRVLVYFQMTRMIDLMEEYLAFRQYKYLRLDGASTISERRDMVMDWQTKWVVSLALFLRLLLTPFILQARALHLSSFDPCWRTRHQSHRRRHRHLLRLGLEPLGPPLLLATLDALQADFLFFYRTTLKPWIAPIDSVRPSRSPSTASSPRTPSMSVSSSWLGE